MARYPYQSFIQDGNGRAVESVTVTVYEADTTTLATIYAAKTGGSAITGSYVTTAESGYFIFYIDSSDYSASQMFDLVPSKSGYSLDTIEDVLVVITNTFDDIYTDTIYEKTAATGVTIDGVLLKDSEVTTDVIKEKTGAAGVTIDSLTIKDAGFALGSDADGDDYQRVAGVLARRAIGAANLKSFVNAAGTAKEWAAGIKIGTFTRNTTTASGDQAVAGVGFKPSHVMFLAGELLTSKTSIGIDNGTARYHLSDYHGVTASTWSTSDSASIVAYETSADRTVGSISALGADGFTITWTKVGSPTGTISIYYLAFR